MSTRNVVLGAAATCIAVGSAFASYLNLVIIKVKIGGVTKSVTVQADPSCSGTQLCRVKVVTKNGVVTVAAAATILTAAGINARPGAGLLTSTIARTQG